MRPGLRNNPLLAVMFLMVEGGSTKEVARLAKPLNSVLNCPPVPSAHMPSNRVSYMPTVISLGQEHLFLLKVRQ